MLARRRDIPWFPGAVLAALVFTAVFAFYLAPLSPTEGDITQKLIPPVWLERGNPANRLGPDGFGGAVRSRIIYGSKISLSVSLIAIGLAGRIGRFLALTPAFPVNSPD